VFKTMALRDLRVYAEASSGHVWRHRDAAGCEVDAVIGFPDGSWGAADCVLTAPEVDAAERRLLRLREVSSGPDGGAGRRGATGRAAVARAGAVRSRAGPAFLAVVTGTDRGFTLPSGIHVVPLGALAP
jgi:hypothetical protein